MYLIQRQTKQPTNTMPASLTSYTPSQLKYLQGTYDNLLYTILAIFHTQDKLISLLVIDHHKGEVKNVSVDGSKMTRHMTRLAVYYYLHNSFMRGETYGYLVDWQPDRTIGGTIIVSKSLFTERYCTSLTDKFPNLLIVKYDGSKRDQLPGILHDTMMIYNPKLPHSSRLWAMEHTNKLIQSRMRQLKRQDTRSPDNVADHPGLTE